VIAVAWGFNSAEALAKENPDCLIHHPKELVDAVNSLSG
jgi:phosphoglycolate phosphatase